MSKRRKWKEAVNEAVREIGEFQSGRKKPLDTGFSHLNENCIGGFFNQDIIVIAGLQGHGKTWFSQRIVKNLKELNPNVKIAFLRLAYEMTVFKLLLRTIKQGTKMLMSEILFKKPDADTKQKFKDIIDKERDTDAELVDEALTSSEFFAEVAEFLEANKDKDSCVVELDHIALTKVEKGDLKKAMDEVMAHCLILKKRFPNVIFIILSQLNRDIEGRNNDAEKQPKVSDLFNSSTMGHCADVIIVVHNPYLLGHSKYMVVNKEKYDYMTEFFEHKGRASKSATTSFETLNTLFYHYLKVRTPDGDDYRSVFGERIGKPLMTTEEWLKQPIPRKAEIEF